MNKWLIPIAVVVSLCLVPAAQADDRGYYRAQGVAIGVASTLFLDHFLHGHNRGSSVVHVDYRYGDGVYGRGYSDLGSRYDYRDRYRDGRRHAYGHKKQHQKSKAYRKGYRQGYRDGLAYGSPRRWYGGHDRYDHRRNPYSRHDRRCR
ncbi:MAG: hypothetical protein R3231_01115 [bacterium]|nr:hypothetical protein [bacterium]